MKRFDVALIVLFDSEKRILLQHRSPDTEILPGYWAFFGGRIGPAETPRDAVFREALEELNCTLKDPRIIVEQDFKEGDAKGRLYVFIESLQGDKSVLRLQEGQGWGWYKESEILSLKMVDRDRQIIKVIWEYFRKNNQRPLDKITGHS
jgi:8-oxo-dGTP diphosphatase